MAHALHPHPSPHHSRLTPRIRWKHWLRWIFFFGLLFIFLVLAGGIFGYFILRRDLPSLEQILHRHVAQSTKIYDRTGTVLLYEISDGERRTVVSLQNIPQSLRDATVAIEDENFYREPAFDWRAIIRSLLIDLRSRKILQGGSTITQQLAKNAFLSPEQTVTRKLKELILATDLNKYYSKDQILELYLNEIPYGPTAYGVEAASETFFGKNVSNLTLGESAVLAALPKAPTYYSPWGSHQAELLARGRLILQKMKELGYVSEAAYQTALKEKIAFSTQDRTIKAPHFVMAVQEYLTQKYGEDLVQQGGLQVITTLDWDLQQLGENVVRAGADRNASLYGGKNASLVAEDPKTGQILVLVGSRDYFDTANNGNFNVATQGLRQPGSSLKPFVYLTAFEKGYVPQTVIFDTPTEFAVQNPDCPLIPVYTTEDTSSTAAGCFHPHDFDFAFKGPMSLRQALALSRNIPAVKLLYLAGMNDVIQNLTRFGISTLTDPNKYGLSLVLGGGAVRLIDVVGAYSALAQDGVKHPQTYILTVKDAAGNTIESFRDSSEQVAPPQIVRLVNDVLTDVNARRGLFGASLSYTTLSDRDVALKTGTSNDWRDAWTFGYTPSLVVGVWAGNNNNAPMYKNGSSIFATVPIWHDFFAGAHAARNFPTEAFPKPDPVTPAKPILAGDYLANNEIHSILYYVDRKDPTGPPPPDPTADQQFVNWETGVLTWAAQNLPSFAQYNRAVLGFGSSTTPFGALTRIEVTNPINGSLLQGNSLSLAANLWSSQPLSIVRIFLNGQLLESIPGPFPLQTTYALIRTIPLRGETQQNLLEIQALSDTTAVVAKAQAIFYH